MFKILVVDDEPIHRRGLTNMLKRINPDYYVINAKNGAEALEYINGNQVDIVITDIRMPIMDGLNMIENLGYRAKEMKIILLSVYGYFEYAQKALSLGAFDYILKPVDEDKLKEVIKKAENRILEERAEKSEKEKLKLQLNNVFSECFENNMNKNEPIIQKCKKYIEDNYMNDISLESVARMFYFNPSYFSNYFKCKTNINFCEYLLEVRMNKAISLLKSTNYKVFEIAKKVGYKDPKYFNRMFKKKFGLSPEECRRSIGSD